MVLGTWNPRTLELEPKRFSSLQPWLFTKSVRGQYKTVSTKLNKQTNKGYSNESITKNDEGHIQRNHFNKEWGEEGNIACLQIKEW